MYVPPPRRMDELDMTPALGRPAPVWAPTPGVPIIARILAYSFAALMVISLVASCRSPEVDAITVPATWSALKTTTGIALAYPADWKFVDVPETALKRTGNEAEYDFIQHPDDLGQITALTVRLTGPVDPYSLSQNLERISAKAVANYQAQISGEDVASVSEHAHAFNFTQRGHAMAGIVALYTHDHHVLCLIVVGPADSGDGLKRLVREMADRTQYPE